MGNFSEKQDAVGIIFAAFGEVPEAARAAWLTPFVADAMPFYQGEPVTDMFHAITELCGLSSVLNAAVKARDIPVPEQVYESPVIEIVEEVTPIQETTEGEE